MNNKWLKLMAMILLLFVVMVSVHGASAAGSTGTGSINLTTLGSPSTQNFDTLATSGTDIDMAINGWYIYEALTGTAADGQYRAGTGSDNAGDVYSFGAAATAERALGSLASGSVLPSYGASFTNNTGATIASLDISYTGEMWRAGVALRTTVDRLDFTYSTDATSLTTGTWTDIDNLDFTSPTLNVATAGALNGNAAANQTALIHTITSLNIAPGATFWIRWNDPDFTSADDGLAVDNFSLTPNGGTGDEAPSITATNPIDNAINVAANTTVTLNFSEMVDIAGTVQVAGSVSPTQNLTPATNDNLTFTLNPSAFTAGETVTVTVLATQVTDQDTEDPPDNLAADYVFDFQIASPVPICDQTFTPIYSIQGSGTAAAITGNVTTEGVVVSDNQTSAGLQGFYIQDSTGDADATTSDGIFVFTGAAEDTVSAGQYVRVTGFARERFNMTTLNGSNSNTAIVPAANIVDCGPGSVAPIDVTMPFADATYLERFEGMLVRFPQELVIAEYFNYDQFGEIVLALPLDGETRPFTPTAIDEPGAPALARALANSLRRITLDDGRGGSNPAILRHPNGADFALANRFRGGDTVQNAIGVLAFDFSLYRIIPTGPATYTEINPRPVAPEPIPAALHVAAMNTLNFFLTPDAIQEPSNSPDNPDDNDCGGLANLECRGFDGDQPTEFTRQRDKLLAALAGLNADVIGLNEIENTPGVDPLGDPTNGIVAGLNALLGSGTYASIDTGVIGTDAIRVGLIYKPASVTPVGAYQVLDTSDDPRFLDSRNRPVLAQTFEEVESGARFTIAVNHLKSKGSACTGDPDANDGQGNCNVTRTQAAQALVDWLATDPTGSGDPDFLIMGDLNSYAMEDPIDAIKLGADDTASTSDDYLNLIAHYQGTSAYSYTFDGQAGYLDHALANTSLAAQVTGAVDWHINSDEPDVVDYDTTFKPPSQEALYEPNAYRASDHDPVVVGLNLTVPDTTPPTTTILTNPTNPSASANASFTFTGSDDVGGVTFECSLDGGPWTACANPQTYNSLSDGSHTFEVRANDGTNVDPTPASYTWVIDTTAPDTSITDNPTDPSNNANPSFSFTGDDGSGVGGVTFECRIDLGPWAPCSSPQVYGGLGEGSHTFEVRAKDSLGNTDSSPASYTWVIDTTAPDTFIDSGPTDPTNSTSASFTFHGDDGAGSGIASFECDLDGGGFAACTSPQTYINLSDGLHTFQVRAIDGAGNVDQSPASYPWTIDATAPDTTITSNPANPTNSTSASFSFTGNDGSGVGVASFECQLDGGGFAACTSPQNYTGLAAGSHTFQVRAVDALGNTDQTPASYTWTINPPIYTFDGFYSPLVNPPLFNRIKAGSTVTLKFSLGGAYGLSVFEAGYPASQPISCTTNQPIGPLVIATGSSLKYNARSGVYTYSWSTVKGWTGCRELIFIFNDGTEATALFQFR